MDPNWPSTLHGMDAWRWSDGTTEVTEIAVIGLIAATIFIALIPRAVWAALAWVVLVVVSGYIAWICLLLFLVSLS